MGQQHQQNNYLGRDSSGKAFISLPLLRAISSGIIRSKKPTLPRRTIQPLERLTSSIVFRRFTTGTAVFTLAFLCAFITASVATPVQNSNADTRVYANIDGSDDYVNVSSPDSVSVDLRPTSDGASVVVSQQVTTTTSSDSGYRLYISTNSTSDEDSRKLQNETLIASGSTNAYLAPSSGTISNPTTLTTNTWGYALSTTGDNNGEVTTSSQFIGVPLLGAEHLINNIQTAVTDSTSANAITTVYFGMNANSSRPSGLYTAYVTYTAVAEATGKTPSISVSPYAFPNLAAYDSINFSDNILTIATPLYAAADVNLGTPTVSFTDGTNTYSCGNVSRLALDSNNVALTCELPEMDFVGEYDVTVTISQYDKTWTLEDAILRYVPWEKLQYMQDMTAYACDEIDTPTAFNDGSASPVYTYTMNNVTVTDTEVSNNLAAYWSGTAADGSDASYLSYGYIKNVNIGVPEKVLTDVRDGNIYHVRKLADGNCWMTENLRLVFAGSDGTGYIGSAEPTGAVNNSAAIDGAHTYARSYDGVSYGPDIEIVANHTLDEDYSNVGRNAVGGTSASNWDSSSLGDFAYTEFYDSSKSAATYGSQGYQSYWNSTDAASSKHSVSSAYVAGYASSNSNTYARSLYNPNSRTGCAKPAQPNHNNNNATNDCFLQDNETQKIGTYYNWLAATAGTGTNSFSSGNTTDSICPAGWQLPVDGSKTTNKSWDKLIYGTYGGDVEDRSIDAVNNVAAGGTPTNTITSGYFQTLAGYHLWALTNQIRKAPLSLAFSGYYDMGGNIKFIGGETNYWSATARDASYIYYLFSRPGILHPRNYYIFKGGGMPIRCVSQ